MKNTQVCIFAILVLTFSFKSFSQKYDVEALCNELATGGHLVKQLGGGVASNMDRIYGKGIGEDIYQAHIMTPDWTPEYFSSAVNAFCRYEVVLSAKIIKSFEQEFKGCQDDKVDNKFQCIDSFIQIRYN